ncbi:hypothetical protein ACOME3_005692 [Neoechinorhynchus agilis]
MSATKPTNLSSSDLMLRDMLDELKRRACKFKESHNHKAHGDSKSTRRRRRRRSRNSPRRSSDTFNSVVDFIDQIDRLGLEPQISANRQSTGAFDCIGLNTISFASVRKQQLPISQGFTPTSASLKQRNKFFSLSTQSRRRSKSADPLMERMSMSPNLPLPTMTYQDYPPPPSGRTNRRIILLIDAKTHFIANFNDEAICIFGSQALGDFYQLIPDKYSQWATKTMETAIEFHLNNTKDKGRGLILDTGKLMEVYDKEYNEIGVCAYVHLIPSKSIEDSIDRTLLLIVFERSYKFEAACTINSSSGIIEDHDSNFSIMFGTANAKQRLVNHRLQEFLKLEGQKYRDSEGKFHEINPLVYLDYVARMGTSITGLTLNGTVFPVLVLKTEINGHILLRLQEFTNVCGLIIVDEHGFIVDYNSTLMRLFFGYADHYRNQELICPVKNKHIHLLVPTFQKVFSTRHHIYPVIDPHVLDGEYKTEIEDSVCCAKLVSGTLDRLDGTDPHVRANALGFNSPFAKDRLKNSRLFDVDESADHLQKPPSKRRNQVDFRREAIMRNMKHNIEQNSPTDRVAAQQRLSHAVAPPTTFQTPRRIRVEDGLPIGDGVSPNLSSKRRSLLRLAGNPGLVERRFLFQEGTFCGPCRHRNGSELQARFIVSRIPSGFYAIWLSRPENDQHAFELQESVLVERYKDSKLEEESLVDEDSQTGYADLYDDVIEVTRGRFGPLFVSKTKYEVNQNVLTTRYLSKDELEGAKIHMESMCDNLVFEGIKHKTPKRVPYGIKVLYGLQKHPCFVKLLDVFEDNQYYKIVTLLHDIQMFTAMRSTMDEGLASFMFRQIVSGVHYLHEEIGCAVRNLRADNISINSAFRMKLTDLSFAHPLHLCTDRWDTMIVGNLDYCPPEALLNYKYDPRASDVWSMGVILYLILFGFMPFKDPDMIVCTERTYPCLISTSLRDLFESVFHLTNRPTASSLTQHPWICFDVDLCAYKWEDVLKNADAMAHIDYDDFQRARLNAILELPECRNAPHEFKIGDDDSDSCTFPIEHHSNEPDGDYQLLGLKNPIDECKFEPSVVDVLNQSILEDDFDEDTDEEMLVADIPKRRRLSEFTDVMTECDDCVFKGLGPNFNAVATMDTSDVYVGMDLGCPLSSPKLAKIYDHSSALNKTFRASDDDEDGQQGNAVTHHGNILSGNQCNHLNVNFLDEEEEEDVQENNEIMECFGDER